MGSMVNPGIQDAKSKMGYHTMVDFQQRSADQLASPKSVKIPINFTRTPMS